MLRFTSLRKHIEPVVLLAQFASSFYDTGLQMVVKERCAKMTSTNYTDTEDDTQRLMSDFYMTYTMISNLLPFLPAYFLAKFGDQGFRKIPIAVPLVGYLISRTLLFLVVLFELPIEVMFGGAAVYGLFGGYSSYWAGVMALASVCSCEEQRSRLLMRIELIYGIAGFAGSLASGHIFKIRTFDLEKGTVLVGLSILLYLMCFLYITCFHKTSTETRSYRSELQGESNGTANQRPLKVVIALLFVSAIFYDVAVGGAMEVLISFVMREPLNWDATYVGYGNAAGSLIFITSFLGVLVFSRCISDAVMIMIGMVSFGGGIYFMAFVKATYMFYVARALSLFALIPMTTIRSLLSKQVQGSSYGKILIVLQLSFTLASLAYSPIYTKIYQATLAWFPGFVFLLSSILTVLAIIPVSIVGCKTARQRGYERIQGN